MESETASTSSCAMQPKPSSSHHMSYCKRASHRHMAPGPIGRNPYLNFLREVRQRFTDLSAVEVVEYGAQIWKEMPREHKLNYIEAAFYAPRKRKYTEEHHEGCEMCDDDMEPEDGCRRRRRKKPCPCPCPCPPKRRRRRCPRRRKPKCPKRRRRRRRC